VKPRVFIGSSTEGLQVAESLNLRLTKECETVPWNGSPFVVSETYIASLEKALSDVEFAVLVVTPDDTREKRGIEGKIPRDNVVFELGLFMGRLGRERTFIVCDPAVVDLPTDLSGLAVAEYDSKRSDNDWISALIPAATRILQAVRRAPRLVAASNHAQSSALADPEALYNSIVAWNPSTDDEIVIQTSNTVWAWQIMPTLIHWRLSGVPVRVHAPSVTAPALAARAEKARRTLLGELGVRICVTDTPGISGFFLKTPYPDESVALIVNERNEEGPRFARRYQGSADSAAVEALLDKLPSGAGTTGEADFTPTLLEQDANEIVAMLRKGVKQYNAPSVHITFGPVPTKDLLLMSPYARAYKYAQIKRLVNWYTDRDRPLFGALAVTLRSGEKSIITPPVVEMATEGPIVMEGTTRAAYCHKNQLGDYHCIVVRGVDDPLPGSPVRINEVTISERSLSQRERTEDYQEQLYRRIERAIHPY
jgi:hypothetical protein